MQLDERIGVAKDVVGREVGGEMVLLNMHTGFYFGLDGVGARAWELITQEARTLAEISDVIEAEFDAPRERIEADVIALATELHEKELITRV